jgi:hypothetical protein
MSRKTPKRSQEMNYRKKTDLEESNVQAPALLQQEGIYNI